jgi:hypothetical protein
MLEILQIFFQLIIFILFTFFPINKFTLSRFSSVYINSNINAFLINIVILLNTFLLLSFFKVNMNFIFIFILIMNLFLFAYNFSDIYREIINKKNIFFEISFILICFLLFIKVAANPSLGWDGLAFWLSKTNSFYLGGSYFDMPHPHYPQLGSYMWAFFWKNSLIEKEYFGRLFFYYLYLISIFTITLSLKESSNIKKLILIFFLILFTFDFDGKLSGYQDYLIFVLLILCFKILIEINSNLKIFQSLFYFILLIMTTMLLPWVKNEGIFYAIFIAIIYCFFNTQFLYKKIFFLFLVIISCSTQIFFIKIILAESKTISGFVPLGQIPSIDGMIISNIFTIKELFFRFFYTSFYLIRSAFQYPLILINFFIFFISLKYYKYLKNINIFYTFFFLNLAFIYVIYITTTAPFLWHLQTSISRLMLQTCGLYFFLFIDLFNKKIIKI